MNTVIPIIVLGLAQWTPANTTRPPEHCSKRTGDDLHLLLSDLELTSTYDLGDLHSSVEVKQFLQLLHNKFFPRIHFLVLSNYTRAMALLQIVDQFDVESNRSTDFSHYSYWMLACYSPCQPRTPLLSHLYNLENVAMISSQMVGCPVLSQLIATAGGRNLSAGKYLDGIENEQDVFPNMRYGLNNRKLIVSTIPNEAFVMKVENGFDGYLVDVLKTIASTLNFSYELVHPTDMRWGGIVDGRWDGLIGQLERREVDLVVAALIINEDREKVMDFLYPPIFTTKDDIMYRLEYEELKSQPIFLRPLNSYLFLILSITLVVITLVAYILFRWDDDANTRKLPISDVLFYMFGILICRGLQINPRNQPARLLLFSWGAFAVIITTCYSAHLVAVLSNQYPKHPFRSLGELVRQKEYKWGFKLGGIREHIFNRSKYGDVKLAWEGMLEYNKTDPQVMSELDSVHIAKVKTEKYAFITHRFMIEKIRSEDCDIRYVGQNIMWHQLGLGVPTNYPITREIENVLNTIVDSGLSDIWWRRWTKTKGDQCNKERKLNTLRLQDTVLAFYILCVGLGVSLIVLLIELCKHTMRKPKSNYLEQS